MPLLIGLGGAATLAALIALEITEARLGSSLFFTLTAVPCIVYLLLVVRLSGPARPSRQTVSTDVASTPPTSSVPRHRYGSRRLLLVALAFTVAFRAPLLVRKANYDSDMVRYIWDGRVQRFGYNPFAVLPSDPEVARTHTDDTRRMPSLHDRTPYPAAAQLFFRALVTVAGDSSRAMKLALVACDLLTIGVLLAWLRGSQRSPWLALLYAWNPLVILEIAHSGHIDALGSFWIAVSAWMLSTGRRMRAAMAFVIAVAAKLLPIVLIPLFWKRIRARDAAAAIALLILIYLPFASAGLLPLGALPNVVQYVRFNGPIFKSLAALTSPQTAALAAVLGGIGIAAWTRYKFSVDDPAGWAWPMAVALAGAPVIYPWYLLYLTPFLFTRRTLPLLVWTLSVLPVYRVWELGHYHGHRWRVPATTLWLEYGVVVATMVWMGVKTGRRRVQFP